MQLIPLNGIKTTFKLRILTHLVNSGELQGVGGMTKIIRPTKEFIKCTFRSQRSHLYPFIAQHYFKSHWSSYAILGDECCTNIIFLLSCDLRFSKHMYANAMQSIILFVYAITAISVHHIFFLSRKKYSCCNKKSI